MRMKYAVDQLAYVYILNSYFKYFCVSEILLNSNNLQDNNVERIFRIFIEQIYANLNNLCAYINKYYLPE